MSELLPLATLFLHPMDITTPMTWLMFPLSIVAAVVYKTIRAKELSKISGEILRLSALIVVCELGLIAAGWAYLTFLH